MLEQIFPYLFFFIAFLIVAAAFFFAYWNWKRIGELMEPFSQRHGLQYQAPSFIFIGYPSITGMYRGHAIRIHMYRRGTGKNSRTYTALEVTPAQRSDLRFHIYEASLWSTVAKMFGMQDVEIGDESFDKRFIIKTNNPQMLATFLNPALRESFQALADKYTSWEIEFNGTIFSYHRKGSFGNPKMVAEIEEMMPFCCDLADQLKYIK